MCMRAHAQARDILSSFLATSLSSIKERGRGRERELWEEQIKQVGEKEGNKFLECRVFLPLLHELKNKSPKVSQIFRGTCVSMTSLG